VRVVEAVVGAEVWVVKAVKAVEVRWSALPRPRLVFLALGLEGALSARGRRFYRVRAPVAGSASRGGCDFRGRLSVFASELSKALGVLLGGKPKHSSGPRHPVALRALAPRLGVPVLPTFYGAFFDLLQIL
jgi:hypothetical protein